MKNFQITIIGMLLLLPVAIILYEGLNGYAMDRSARWGIGAPKNMVVHSAINDKTYDVDVFHGIITPKTDSGSKNAFPRNPWLANFSQSGNLVTNISYARTGNYFFKAGTFYSKENKLIFTTKGGTNSIYWSSNANIVYFNDYSTDNRESKSLYLCDLKSGEIRERKYELPNGERLSVDRIESISDNSK